MGLRRTELSAAATAAHSSSPEIIIRSLEEDIVLGRAHPRQRLIEDDLCKRFAVTRHVLRQALAELERMGLVERPPNRGALVRSFTPEEVEQIYAVRDLLETTAASQIRFPVAEAGLKELWDIQARHDHAVETANLTQVFRFNRQLHRKLFSLCRNVYLSADIERHAQLAHGIRFLVLTDEHLRQKARAEHHRMIDALAKGNRDALVSLCRNHLLASKSAYLRAYGSPDRDFCL